MVTYLVGSGGIQASEAISLYLEPEVDQDDCLEVVNVPTEDDVDELEAGRDALEISRTDWAT